MTQLMAFVFISMAAGYLAGLFTLSIKHEKEVHELSTVIANITQKYNKLYNVMLTRGLGVPAPSMDAEWVDGEVVFLSSESRTTVQTCTPEEDSEDGTS